MRPIASITIATLVLALTGCSKPPAASAARPADGSLAVMSFNIRYGTAGDGGNRWSKRRGLLLETIRKHAPDLVGLQEALDFQLDEIAEALPEYGQIGVGRQDGRRGGEHVAVLYRKSRFIVSVSGTFWLSGTTRYRHQGLLAETHDGYRRVRAMAASLTAAEKLMHRRMST